MILEEGRLYKTGDNRIALIKRIHREFEAYMWVEADLLTEDGEVCGKATYHISGMVGPEACPMDLVERINA